MLYYRFSTLFHIIKSRETPLLPYLLVLMCELVLTLLWICHRPSKWRPVTRVAYPERLPLDETLLPPLDVFIFTTNPNKEPSLGVMNTVISVMAMDYPADKIAVYLSDDGGAPVTLQAMREAWKFAKAWIPFCIKYQVQNRCPDAYFSAAYQFISTPEFLDDRKQIEMKYEEFKESLDRNFETIGGSVSGDHPPIVEVINDANGSGGDSQQKGMPLLVYVAREKRPSHPHHFKSGAINVLLRVSALLSNAPYFLVLDCDHYCSDATAARQAMCFYFDPHLSPKLAWVQFPQHFHNISQHDLYDGNLHYYWREWEGLDGMRGPTVTGCDFVMNREAFYGMDTIPKGTDLNQLRKYFGSSNELIKATYKHYKPNVSRDEGIVSEALQKEINLIASCTYDDGTEWGNKVGAKYNTIIEDSMASHSLHTRGWVSVWYDPTRPCFLGTCPTNLNDMLVQQTRWSLGLLQMAFSDRSPILTFFKMSIFQSMSYVGLTLDPLYAVPFFGLGIVPQICLLHGISLYPKVSSPFFFVFAFIFISSQLKHVQEVVSYGDPLRTSLYDLRVWMMKCGACYLYAIVNAILESFGLSEANFSLTSKVFDEEEMKRHQEGIYDFQSSPQLMVPLCSMYLVNLVAFVVGIARIYGAGCKGSELFAQAVIPWFGVIVNYHLLDGMMMRTDKGRISPSTCMLSVAVSTTILFLGSLIVYF